MKLTKNKLESLILEMYSKEQEKKILDLIKKTRNKLFLLEEVGGFFPTTINSVYYFDDIERPIKDITTGPLGRKKVKNHYSAMQRIAEILEEVNQYLVLLETLEIEGNIAINALIMIYGVTSGQNVGHVAFMDDFDGDEDFDDFAFARIYGNSSEPEFNDGVYVEILYDGNNTLYDEKGGDGNEEILMFNDVHEGNYTFNMYNGSSDGDLLQSGWMHSYGSLNTNYGEYFESCVATIM